VNRAAVLVDDVDRQHYLSLLEAVLRRNEIALHAYVLMGNHVHLLASASRGGATSKGPAGSRQCYVQAFNRRHRRTGTLWEGRFKSCLVETDRYLLTVYRYIELNPVRAAMVAAPEKYRWSSIHANLGVRSDPLVTPHPTFLAFGDDPIARAGAYRTWLYEAIDATELQSIREHLKQERALGDARFQAMVEKALNRPVSTRPRGRPAGRAEDG
jgi:putative transposase